MEGGWKSKSSFPFIRSVDGIQRETTREEILLYMEVNISDESTRGGSYNSFVTSGWHPFAFLMFDLKSKERGNHLFARRKALQGNLTNPSFVDNFDSPSLVFL